MFRKSKLSGHNIFTNKLSGRKGFTERRSPFEIRQDVMLQEKPKTKLQLEFSSGPKDTFADRLRKLLNN